MDGEIKSRNKIIKFFGSLEKWEKLYYLYVVKKNREARSRNKKKKEADIMSNLKANRVIALKQVGVNKKEVEEYRKSSREYFVQ